MEIFNEQPVDWRDLQVKVAQIFEGMGCSVEVEKDVETVRGIVNIDVHILDNSSFPAMKYICECKYWNTSVPKTIVHSFRTVVNDYGASAGFLIAKIGFQSGAFEAAKNSNVQLLDWNEFTSLVDDRWIESLVDKMDNIGRALRVYTNPLDGRCYERAKALGSDQLIRYNHLCHEYEVISYQCLRVLYIDPGERVSKENINIIIENVKSNIEELKDVSSYHEYFHTIIDLCSNGLMKFDFLFGERMQKYMV